MVVEDLTSEDSHSPPLDLLVRSILFRVLMPGWANGNRPNGQMAIDKIRDESVVDFDRSPCMIGDLRIYPRMCGPLPSKLYVPIDRFLL
jgi:hypothetical protein